MHVTAQLRPLRPDDADAVLAINEAVVHKLAPMDHPEYLWFLEVATCAWAAEVDGEVAGFVLVLEPGHAYDSRNYRWFSERYDDFLYLDRVAIHHDHRRQGVGGVIYDGVEALAAAQGRPVLLEVNVEPPNHASLAFHQSRGYLPVDTLDHPGGKRVQLLERPTDR